MIMLTMNYIDIHIEMLLLVALLQHAGIFSEFS